VMCGGSELLRINFPMARVSLARSLVENSMCSGSLMRMPVRSSPPVCCLKDICRATGTVGWYFSVYAFMRISSALLKASSHDASACPAGVSAGATAWADAVNGSRRIRIHPTIKAAERGMRWPDPNVPLSMSPLLPLFGRQTLAAVDSSKGSSSAAPQLCQD
jgi:hypothetical protein